MKSFLGRHPTRNLERRNSCRVPHVIAFQISFVFALFGSSFLLLCSSLSLSVFLTSTSRVSHCPFLPNFIRSRLLYQCTDQITNVSTRISGYLMLADLSIVVRPNHRKKDAKATTTNLEKLDALLNDSDCSGGRHWWT